MTDRTVRVRLEAVTGLYQSKLVQAGASTRTFAKQVDAASAKNRAGMNALGLGAVAVGASMLYGFGKAASAAADFDAAMSGVSAASQGTAKELGLLRESALKAGADTAFSATQAADGQEQLIKAGVSVRDVLGGGLIGALDLAAAGELAVGDAAEIAASAMTQFGLAGRNVPHIADLLAAGAGKAQGSVGDLGMALNQAGLVANSTGLSIEETTAGLASFASAGLVGSDAGTSFKSMLQRLTPQSKEAQARMDELGISAYDAQGNFIGLEKFAGNLQGALEDLTPQQRNAAMATIFGSDAVRAANVLYEQGASGIERWTRLVDDQGFAASVAATRLDNLRGDQEKFSGSLETALIKSGTAANFVLREMTQAATGVINVYNDLPGPVQAAATAVLGVGGAATLAGGAAILLIPKVYETKKALDAMGISAKLASVSLGTTAKTLSLIAWPVAAAAATAEALKALGAEEITLTRAQRDAQRSFELGIITQKEFNEVMGESKDDVGSAISSIQGLADQALVLALSYEKPQTAAEAFNEELRKQRDLQNALAGGFLGLVSSMNSVRDSGNELAEAQREVNRLQNAGKRGTPEYRDALRALRDAQFGAVEAHVNATSSIRDYGKELKDTGRPQSFVNDQIREYGRRAGLTKAEINDLIKEVNDYRGALGKVPNAKKTNVTAPGLDNVHKKTKELLDFFSRMPGSLAIQADIRGSAGSGPMLGAAGSSSAAASAAAAIVPGPQYQSSGYRPDDKDSYHSVGGGMHAVDYGGTNLEAMYQLLQGTRPTEMILDHKISQNGHEAYYAPSDHTGSNRHLHYYLAAGGYFAQQTSGYMTMAERVPEIVSPVPVMRQVVRQESGTKDMMKQAFVEALFEAGNVAPVNVTGNNVVGRGGMDELADILVTRMERRQVLMTGRRS